VDILLDHGPTCLPVECKSGMTVASDWTASLQKFAGWAAQACERPVVVHGGSEARETSIARFLPWKRIAEISDAPAVAS
jgi:hypothetical protein